MEYKLEIKPAIDPRIRHRIEDVLETEGFDVHGDGTHTDGSSCGTIFSRDED